MARGLEKQESNYSACQLPSRVLLTAGGQKEYDRLMAKLNKKGSDIDSMACFAQVLENPLL